MLDTVLSSSLHFPQYYCLLPLVTTAPASHRFAINLVDGGSVFPPLAGLQSYGNLEYFFF